jgi:hypothetical protein
MLCGPSAYCDPPSAAGSPAQQSTCMYPHNSNQLRALPSQIALRSIRLPHYSRFQVSMLVYGSVRCEGSCGHGSKTHLKPAFSRRLPPGGSFSNRGGARCSLWHICCRTALGAFISAAGFVGAAARRGAGSVHLGSISDLICNISTTVLASQFK